MISVYLKQRISPRIAGGHPWVFANEADRVEGDPVGGEIAEVFNNQGKFVGRGYINPRSQILVRLLTRARSELIDESFFLKKIRTAWEYRKKIGYTRNCRLVFGESDFLPALIIDKFGDYFVLQTLSMGMDRWKASIVDSLKSLFSPAGIYERNDVPVRELEGLPQQKGFLSAPFDPRILIEENGLRFLVDVEQGQKTGYFLDQQDNRRAIRHIVKDADVLGAFCYTGSFEIHAAHFGARSVWGVDISEQAIAMAREHAALNSVSDTCHFEATNAFDMLKQLSLEKKQFDVVMLDPPAFTKSRETIDNAIKGYKEINLRAMKVVKPGGFLVTSSCTNLVRPDLFLDTIASAAQDAKKQLRQLVYQSQSPDHPIVRSMENTNYLKFLIVQVL